MIDKSWIYIRNKVDPRFRAGAKEFSNYTKDMVDEWGTISCPCTKCNNSKRVKHELLYDHLVTWGFQSAYDVWINHGERLRVPGLWGDVVEQETEAENGAEAAPRDREDNDSFFDDMEGLVSDVGPDIVLDTLVNDMEKELYPGSGESVLSFLVHLMHAKVQNQWTNSSFDVLLKLIQKFFKHANIPNRYYDVKKYLRVMGLGYESIHVCKFDCSLFWKENEKLHNCAVCGESRWLNPNTTGKKLPHKTLRYFPVTPRLKRLYSSRHTASDMTWHSRRSITEGVLRHPADGESWKKFDTDFPDFAGDSRNVRLGLASDGFNPFGNKSNAYSMWPVILMPYNLPPWRCMSDTSMMMTLLIPGRHSPGKDIDVFLQPLVAELNQLWKNGVEAFDAAKKENFNLRAALLWTVNDFPAYGYLSSWITSGYDACPTCMDETVCVRMKDKLAYVGHRRFLPIDHPMRRSRMFDNHRELRHPPKEHSGEDILKQLDTLPIRPLGKHPAINSRKRKRDPKELKWSKRSIFFQLPYWHKLLIRHNIDVMHVEKNILDNILSTFLDIPGKSKDTDKGRLDLAEMGIRKELHLREENNRVVKPHAAYVLKPSDRQKFFTFLKSVKFPDGVAANIGGNIDVANRKIGNLKSHDCHMLMQRVLPIAIRPYLKTEIRDTLVEFMHYFKKLTARTLKVSDLEAMEKDIVLILCKLERIYPRSFFTIMVHLSLHLAREAILGGPVAFRWMYPIERYLGSLKKYVRNRARPEGSIAEGYVVTEALKYCSQYLSGVSRSERYEDVSTKNNRTSELDLFKVVSRGLGKRTFTTLSPELLRKAWWYCLNNCPEVQKYINEYKAQVDSEVTPLFMENNFPPWFEKKITNMEGVSVELYTLACGPQRLVFSYTGCVVNGVKFLVESRDKDRTTQNSGVSVPGTVEAVEDDYYGVLQDVIQLNFVNDYSVCLFKCKWFDTNPDGHNAFFDPKYISMDTTKQWYKEEPFIFASQAKQVYYIQDCSRGKDWKIVELFIHRHIWDIPDDFDDDKEMEAFEKSILEDERVLAIDSIVIEHGLDLDSLLINQENVDAQPVDSGIRSSIHVSDDDFINDEMDDDDTLAEYDDNPDENIANEDDEDDSDELDLDLSDDEALE